MRLEKKEQIEHLKSIGVKGAMLGRAGVWNPAIFDMLKGNPVSSIDSLKKEYLDLAEKYNSKPVYRENVLNRMGKTVDIDAQRLI